MHPNQSLGVVTLGMLVIIVGAALVYVLHRRKVLALEQRCFAKGWELGLFGWRFTPRSYLVIAALLLAGVCLQLVFYVLPPTDTLPALIGNIAWHVSMAIVVAVVGYRFQIHVNNVLRDASTPALEFDNASSRKACVAAIVIWSLNYLLEVAGNLSKQVVSAEAAPAVHYVFVVLLFAFGAIAALVRPFIALGHPVWQLRKLAWIGFARAAVLSFLLLLPPTVMRFVTAFGGMTITTSGEDAAVAAMLLFAVFSLFHIFSFEAATLLFARAMQPASSRKATR